MAYIKSILLLPCCVLLLAACDRPACTNTNPVFDKYSPGQREYRNELVKQIRNLQNLRMRYWVGGYNEQGEKAEMTIYIQGEGLCAKGILDITHIPANDQHMGNYKKAKDGGYAGSELSGLRYHIDSAADGCRLVYDGVDHIAD